MKILENIQQNTEEWANARRGKITGSKLNDVIVSRGNGKKLASFQLIADKLSLTDDTEDGADRGHSLEEEGLMKLQEKLGIEFERVGLCIHDQHPEIANSPDGLHKEKGKYTKAAEIKCLSGARHIQAWYNQKLEPDHFYQALQYFVVNPDLQTLYFAFYDPRIPALPLHYLELHRKDLEQDIQMAYDYQVKEIEWVNDLVTKLSF